jgi:hypothetical protein
MKTLQGLIERNFHIMNDDRFIMEKISFPISIDEDAPEEEVHNAINKAREMIVTNFKAAYPHLKTYLNFDEVIQGKSLEKYDALPMITNTDELPQFKIPKIPIEEQKEWYTHEDAVNNMRKEISKVKYKGILEKVYNPMIKNYPELKEDYEKKLTELQKP